MSQVSTALSHYIERALTATLSDHFVAEFDPGWRSECELRQSGSHVLWKPSPQREPINFAGLATAAAHPIHPDIQAYYGSFWSGSLEGKSEEGPLSLIQLWNPEDFDRLVENLIGHLMVKQRARLPFTVFFATTDVDSELFLSIDNDTGKILLEEPGRPPIREVETDIVRFLDRIEAQNTIPGACL